MRNEAIQGSTNQQTFNRGGREKTNQQTFTNRTGGGKKKDQHGLKTRALSWRCRPTPAPPSNPISPRLFPLVVFEVEPEAEAAAEAVGVGAAQAT